jgi:hypothetical protein
MAYPPFPCLGSNLIVGNETADILAYLFAFVQAQAGSAGSWRLPFLYHKIKTGTRAG